MSRTPRALIVDADPALAALLGEWLGELGVAVAFESTIGSGPRERYDVAIVDLPFPRQGGARRISDVSNTYPGMSVIAVSAAFFPGVQCCGGVAHEIGADYVLPKPLAREALFDIVHRLLRR